jgi:pilus assembly protein CpaC
MKMPIRPLSRSFALSFFAAVLCRMPMGLAQTTPPAAAPSIICDGLENGRIKITTGKSAVLTTRRPYKRISVPDADIAIAKSVGESTILVNPKKAGVTQLIVWDDNDKSQTVDLVVSVDTAVLQEQFKALFPDSKIDVTSANGAIVLSGRVPNTAVAEQAASVAQPYAAKVLNLLEVSGGQQVMLQVRFAEVSRSATSALGVNGAFADGSFTGGSNIGGVNPTNFMPTGKVGATPASAGFNKVESTIVNPSVTLYGAGQIGSFYLENFISALRQNNLLRVLAEPNLTAISGQDASFIAGGSFPIPVAGGASTGGTSNVTIEFKEFGIKLNFTPVVLGNGRIRLKVAPEVSDLDYTAAVKLNGFLVPGLTQRKVTTTVELDEGQTFAIGGLLSNNVTASKDVTPILGDLPVIGALFRSVRYQRRETELIVLVTPRLAEAMNPGQVPPVPGEKWRHPTESDLFLNQDIGGPVSTVPRPTTMPSKGPSPRYFGQYGFTPVEKASVQNSK